jgi:hypothetical protein
MKEDMKRAASIVHNYIDIGCSIERYHTVQQSFIEFFKSDPTFDETEFRKDCAKGLIR